MYAQFYRLSDDKSSSDDVSSQHHNLVSQLSLTSQQPIPRRFATRKYILINHDEHDQGHIRQTSPGAEEALGEQASASVSIAQPGDDRLFGSHDLEGSHVLYQGALFF